MDNIFVLSAEEYKEILDRLKSIDQKIETIKYPQIKLYDNDEVCEIFKIAKRTLQSWRDSGIINPVKIGRKVLYTKEEIERLLYTNIDER